jgi:hypothetical protein
MLRLRKKLGLRNRLYRLMQTLLDRRKTVRSAILMLVLLPLLTACAIGRSVPPPKSVPCPVPPQMDPLPPDVLEKNFTVRMESFLRGKLPEETNSESSSSNAETSTKH